MTLNPQLTRLAFTLADILDRPIAFYPVFVKLTGGLESAVLLSQALYWSKRTKDPDGWFYKSREEWEDETCLNRSKQESARARLRTLPFWFEERRGVPARLFYRLDLQELFLCLTEGSDITLTVDLILKHQSKALKSISKTGYMRAMKAGVKAEPVDCAKVLEAKGMVCGICNGVISYPIGQKTGMLCFDHIVPIAEGGHHVFDNLQPAHVNCNILKGGIAIQLALPDPTGRSDQSILDGLQEADLPDSPAPTLYNDSETTQKNTSETNNTKIDVDKILKSNPEINAATKRIFALWQEIFSTVPTVVTADWKLTPERVKHIGARFRGDCHWTERQLQEAMRGMRITPHNLGKNETGQLYIDPNTCFCNDTRVDKYRQIWLTHVRELEKREADDAARQKVKAQTNGNGSRPVILPADLQPAAQLWQQCLDRIKVKIQSESFDTWFGSIVCEGTKPDPDTKEPVIWLRAPNQVVRDWIKVNYANLMDESFNEVFKTRVSVKWILSLEPSNNERQSTNGLSDHQPESEICQTGEVAQAEG